MAGPQTSILTALGLEPEAEPVSSPSEPVAAGYGPAERLFQPVRTLPGQLTMEGTE